MHKKIHVYCIDLLHHVLQESFKAIMKDENLKELRCD